MTKTRSALLLGLCVCGLTACTPFATYPPDSRTLRPGSVVNEPIPDLMAVSLDHAISMYGSGDDPAINLPAGSGPKLYDKVITRLGTGYPLVTPDLPAYSITKVRARGFQGEVDMFVPNAEGTYSFATFTFRRDAFKGYQHQRTRWWDIDEMPPPVNYVMLEQLPAPEDAPIEQPVLAHD